MSPFAKNWRCPTVSSKNAQIFARHDKLITFRSIQLWQASETLTLLWESMPPVFAGQAGCLRYARTVGFQPALPTKGRQDTSAIKGRGLGEWK